MKSIGASDRWIQGVKNFQSDCHVGPTLLCHFSMLGGPVPLHLHLNRPCPFRTPPSVAGANPNPHLHAPICSGRRPLAPVTHHHEPRPLFTYAMCAYASHACHCAVPWLIAIAGELHRLTSPSTSLALVAISSSFSVLCIVLQRVSLAGFSFLRVSTSPAYQVLTHCLTLSQFSNLIYFLDQCPCSDFDFTCIVSRKSLGNSSLLPWRESILSSCTCYCALSCTTSFLTPLPHCSLQCGLSWF